MNILDTISTGFTTVVDTVVEKNRKCAYINRLKYVIKSETDTLNRAYIALGKHFYKDLKGDPESAEVQRLCKVIDIAKTRLKKAQDRYEYVMMYGMPDAPAPEKEQAEPEDYSFDDLDEGDITICCSDDAEIQSANEKISEAPVKDEPKTEEDSEAAADSDDLFPEI